MCGTQTGKSFKCGTSEKKKKKKKKRNGAPLFTKKRKEKKKLLVSPFDGTEANGLDDLVSRDRKRTDGSAAVGLDSRLSHHSHLVSLESQKT